LHLYVGNLLAQEFYFLQKTNHWLHNPRLPFLIENYFKEKSTSTLRPRGRLATRPRRRTPFDGSGVNFYQVT
jgi:hypothetical protein